MALFDAKRGVRHVPLCAGMLPFQLSMCRTAETQTTEYAAAVAAGEIRLPPTNVDTRDTVMIRTVPAVTVLREEGAAATTHQPFPFSIKRYMKLVRAGDSGRIAPVWMTFLLLLRMRGLDIRLTCVTVQPPGFPSYVVFPLVHMVALQPDATDDAPPSPESALAAICLPTHAAWDNGFVDYRFAGVPGLPFHLLAVRTELFLAAVTVILRSCRWPPRDRDVRIDEVRSYADRTTFRVCAFQAADPVADADDPVKRPIDGLTECSPISVRLVDDVYGLTIDHRRGHHAPLMLGGGLESLIIRYTCPGCFRINDTAHSTVGVCRGCGFNLPDAMVGGYTVPFTFRLRPIPDRSLSSI